MSKTDRGTGSQRGGSATTRSKQNGSKTRVINRVGSPDSQTIKRRKNKNIPATDTLTHEHIETLVSTDAQPRYGKEDLAEFKAVILQRLEAQKKDLAYYQNAHKKADGGATAYDEGMLEITLQEDKARLAKRCQDMIGWLENALIRIEQGTYGVCRVTGKLIPKERLLCVPHATTTVEGKLAEKERRSTTPIVLHGQEN